MDLALRAGKHVALENPASVIFPYLRDVYDCGVDVQYVQPWQHGHPEQKKTGLALFDLPRLTDTDNVYDHMIRRCPAPSVSGCFSCRREPIAARSAPASIPGLPPRWLSSGATTSFTAPRPQRGPQHEQRHPRPDPCGG
ncbi:hypothetical protein AB5I41_31645 [Sphingomonas sp. MMS24-JH45]